MARNLEDDERNDALLLSLRQLRVAPWYRMAHSAPCPYQDSIGTQITTSRSDTTFGIHKSGHQNVKDLPNKQAFNFMLSKDKMTCGVGHLPLSAFFCHFQPEHTRLSGIMLDVVDVPIYYVCLPSRLIGCCMFIDIHWKQMTVCCRLLIKVN